MTPQPLPSEDRRRFEELVREHSGLVLSVAESFTSDANDTEDLFQDIWVTLYEKRESYSGDGSIAGWILTVARNVCRSRYRAEKSRVRRLDRYAQSHDGEDVVWTPPDPHKQLETAERDGRLSRALLELTEREREAIVLRLYEGRSPDEVSRMMGCEKATVRSFIRKGVERLQALMREEPMESGTNGFNGG